MRLLKPPLKAIAAGGEKVAGPSVEAHAVNKVSRALRGFEVVFAAGVVGIANAAIAVAVVDGVLAPDLALANMNPFIAGEQPLVFRIHEACYEALGAIAAADHL